MSAKSPSHSFSKDVYYHTSVIATALKMFTDTWPTDALFDCAKEANTLDAIGWAAKSFVRLGFQFLSPTRRVALESGSSKSNWNAPPL